MLSLARHRGSLLLHIEFTRARLSVRIGKRSCGSRGGFLGLSPNMTSVPDLTNKRFTTGYGIASSWSLPSM
jgi:hypothetical protein